MKVQLADPPHLSHWPIHMSLRLKKETAAPYLLSPLGGGASDLCGIVI